MCIFLQQNGVYIEYLLPEQACSADDPPKRSHRRPQLRKPGASGEVDASAICRHLQCQVRPTICARPDFAAGSLACSLSFLFGQGTRWRVDVCGQQQLPVGIAFQSCSLAFLPALPALPFPSCFNARQHTIRIWKLVHILFAVHKTTDNRQQPPG